MYEGQTFSTGGANSDYNKDLYRIQLATLVQKDSDGNYTEVFEVLQGGEISYATKEKYDGVWAPDFIGGTHGDENIENGEIHMYLDGVELDLTTEDTYTGTHFEFKQTTLIDRHNTPDVQIMRHTQHMLLDTNGLRNNQSVEFLETVRLALTENYLQMCTFNRENPALDEAERELYENFLIDTVKFYDANGNVRYVYDEESDFVGTSDKILGTSNGYSKTYEHPNGERTERLDVTNRYVEYIGNNSGLYGFVGFVVSDGSVKPSNVKIQVRQSQGDNKWYASFETYSSDNGTVPEGEVWNISDYYYIDYVKPVVAE